MTARPFQVYCYVRKKNKKFIQGAQHKRETRIAASSSLCLPLQNKTSMRLCDPRISVLIGLLAGRWIHFMTNLAERNAYIAVWLTEWLWSAHQTCWDWRFTLHCQRRGKFGIGWNTSQMLPENGAKILFEGFLQARMIQYSQDLIKHFACSALENIWNPNFSVCLRRLKHLTYCWADTSFEALLALFIQLHDDILKKLLTHSRPRLNYKHNGSVCKLARQLSCL